MTNGRTLDFNNPVWKALNRRQSTGTACVRCHLLDEPVTKDDAETAVSAAGREYEIRECARTPGWYHVVALPDPGTEPET